MVERRSDIIIIPSKSGIFRALSASLHSADRSRPTTFCRPHALILFQGLYGI